MRFRRSFAAAAPIQKPMTVGLLSSFKGWEKPSQGEAKAVFVTASGKETRYTFEQVKRYSSGRGFELADTTLFLQAVEAYQRMQSRTSRQYGAYLRDRFDF